MNKYRLDYGRAWQFFIEKIDNANTLSKELLKLIDFPKGHFFTLLPSEASISNIYKLYEGGILPQNFPKPISDLDQGYLISAIPTVQKQINQALVKILNSDEKYCCVFDDVSWTYQDVIKFPNNWKVLKENNLIYNYGDEIYFLINNYSQNFLSKILAESSASWHCLGLITKANCKSIKDQKISVEIIQKICRSCEIIIVGAYDGEGYIFWEKEGSGFFSN